MKLDFLKKKNLRLNFQMNQDFHGSSDGRTVT